LGLSEAAKASAGDALEILSVDLLDQERDRVNALLRLSRDLQVPLGWHYLLDLAWILRQVPDTPGTALDAGAGTGLIQWRLSDLGWRVISVDRASRRDLPRRFRTRYPVRGLRQIDLVATPKATAALARGALRRIRDLPALFRALRAGYRPRVMASSRREGGRAGEVLIYNEDLRDLKEVANGSVDLVVSVSALEHNSPETLPAVVAELWRVLRPGGSLIATLGAAREEDWFHEPSQGWNYTEGTLRRIFGIPDHVVSNYDSFDELLDALRGNAELRMGLAAFYFQSGANGMPWGIWDPRYQPVGVRRTKPDV
jgi:SAM-dependent methyltransferase